MSDEPVNPYRAPAAGESTPEDPERPISMLRYAANIGCGSLVIAVGAVGIVVLSMESAGGDAPVGRAILCLALGMASVVPSMRWASRRRPEALRRERHSTRSFAMSAASSESRE